MRAVAVDETGLCVGEVAVPDFVGPFGERIALQLAAAGLVIYAQFDLLGIGGIDCEVDAEAVEGRAEGIGRAGVERVGQ